ncbi:RNA polymerase factor sigma-54 [Lentisphaera profundi]|uniref:RNA polymerase factor sigma-54 n=1 Tax=Lentisphaera profundi TaxID=1658616 RepID=A0ABY7VRG4_9BACT|nr:RNA polymerase factor sigma-54 [Lentisphaera profundi]WDE96292.1 RNA polymerase factor sigma-54 [Lentisphaera profundi]
MEHAFFQSQSMRQEQHLAPHQLLSLEILSLPVMELQQKINEELSLNPTLELDKASGENLAGDPLSENTEMSTEAMAAVDKDESLIGMVQLESYYGDSAFNPDQDKTRQHFFDSLSNEQDLASFLLSQIHQGEITEADIEIANVLIALLNDRGYLNASIEEVAFNAMCSIENAERVLALLQTFDPPGIAARDLRECLLIQLKKTKGSLLYKLVDKHLADLEKNKIKEIAKALKISPMEVQDLIEELQKLNPSPGLAYSNRRPDFISPDVIFELKDGEIEVTSSKDFVPRLRLSDKFMKMLEDPKTDTETKNYLREKLAESRSLLTSLDLRESTLLRISRLVARDQKDFFTNQSSSLNPVTMREISGELDLHETTISRAVAGKYLDSPKGIYTLRSFFNHAVKVNEGEEMTAERIQEMIREIINDEDPEKPISDGKILLALEELGVNIARRTVAKYREIAGFSAASKRKMIF